MINHYVVSEEEKRKIEKRNKLDRALRIIIKITFITFIVAMVLVISLFPQLDSTKEKSVAYLIILTVSSAISIIAIIIVMNLDLKQAKSVVAITCPNCHAEGNKENFERTHEIKIYYYFICPTCGEPSETKNFKEREISIE